MKMKKLFHTQCHMGRASLITVMSDAFRNCQENLALFSTDHEHFLIPFPFMLKTMLSLNYGVRHMQHT